LFKEKIEREKLNFGANLGMYLLSLTSVTLENHLELKQSVDFLKEEAVFKSEELMKFEKHCSALENEVSAFLICYNFAYSLSFTRIKTTIC